MPSMIETLSNQMPVASAKRQKQAQAASDFQLQQAIASAPAGQPIAAPVLQQAGAQSATDLGKQQVQAATQAAETQGQLAGLATQQQTSDIRGRLADLSRGIQKKELSGEAELAQLDADAKRELFDNRMVFEKDRVGRDFMNERQLADYMITHATDIEDFQNKAQALEQASELKMNALEAAHKRITNELEFQSKLSEQKKDIALQEKLLQAKRDLEAKLTKERQKRLARKAKFQTAGTVVGTVVGAYFGGPAGAAVGAQAGSAVGGMAADQTDKSEA